MLLDIGAGSRVPGGAQALPGLFLAPPEPCELSLIIEQIMRLMRWGQCPQRTYLMKQIFFIALLTNEEPLFF